MSRRRPRSIESRIETGLRIASTALGFGLLFALWCISAAKGRV